VILVSKRRFVLALLFTEDRRQVVLMRRTRPAWQAGRVNALGGGMMMAESSAEAARREVLEEAGVDVADWVEVLVWEDAEYRMHVVRALSERAREARTMEDQEIFLADIEALPPNVIDNLRWLLPLSLDADVDLPIVVRSAAGGGSGLTDRARGENSA
jgi:8-oxo-dGTP diphosphatase